MTNVLEVIPEVNRSTGIASLLSMSICRCIESTDSAIILHGLSELLVH